MREKIEDHWFEVTDHILKHKVRKLESEYAELEQELTNQHDRAEDKLSELENKLQLATNELEVFSNLKTAYPESVFPPITTEQYYTMCKASGISVDRVSSHVLREVTKGYAELADETINKINKT